MKHMPMGIVVTGLGNRVINNDIYETKEQGAAGEALGIYLGDADGSVAENNRIGNQALGAGTSYGINIDYSDDVFAVKNRITQMNKGIYYISGSTGKCRDNITNGVTTPYKGGTDAGNNN